MDLNSVDDFGFPTGQAPPEEAPQMPQVFQQVTQNPNHIYNPYAPPGTAGSSSGIYFQGSEAYEVEMSEAERRLSKAGYYKELLSGSLFQSSDNLSQEVEQEIKGYARKQLSILLGMSPDENPVASLFTDEQIEALKAIADRVIDNQAPGQKRKVVEKQKMPTPRPQVRRREMPGTNPSAQPQHQFPMQPGHLWRPEQPPQWAPPQPPQYPQWPQPPMPYRYIPPQPPQWAPPIAPQHDYRVPAPGWTPQNPQQFQPYQPPANQDIPTNGEILREGNKTYKVHYQKMANANPQIVSDLTQAGIQVVQNNSGTFKIIKQDVTPREVVGIPMPSPHAMGAISQAKAAEAIGRISSETNKIVGMI